MPLMLSFSNFFMASTKSPDKDNARSKLSIIQENPLPPSTQGNPITLANRVLTETFYNSM